MFAPPPVMEEYLHHAEEQTSDLTKSFWYGKFLQVLPKSVLLRCREQLGSQQDTLCQPNPQPVTTHACDDIIFKPLGCATLPLWLHVRNADRCLQLCKSSLSPVVHKLVVGAVRNVSDAPSSSVFRPDLTLEWSEVATFLGSDIIHERKNYGEGGVKCAALGKHVCCVLTALPYIHWDSLFAWTGNDKLFAECVKLLQSAAERPDHTHLSLLLCCSALERALGDVYLSMSKGTQCPSLLRDLLTTQELEDIFGPTAMCCLRCLIGPPSGLNLRNILWHGFPSPNEVISDYGYLLLAITATLGRSFTTSLVDIVHRPFITFHQESVIADIFPELGGDDLLMLEHLFSASFFILPSMLPLWLAGLSAFGEGRYHHSLILLMPGLEHSLRRVFACINHCPERALTAESTVLYTTFDEILNPMLPDFSHNALQNEIGNAKLECLLDILVHPEGPRLRDRISHGEVDFYLLSKCLANHVISVCVLFCAQYCLEASLMTVPVVMKCLAVENSYTSLFHPLSMLKRELLGLVKQLESWSGIKVPVSHLDQMQCQQLVESSPGQHLEPVYSDLSTAAKFSATVRRLIKPCYSASVQSVLHQISRLHYDSATSESGSFSAALKELVLQVWSEGVSTLYTPRAHLEMAGLMRQATENTTGTLMQIRDMAVLRYEQFQQKQLRSRQRKNYEHLLASLSNYRGAVCLLVVIVAITIAWLQPPTMTDTTTKAIKFHKKVLQLSENLLSQTSSSKNCWEEADKLVLSLTQLDLSILEGIS